MVRNMNSNKKEKIDILKKTYCIGDDSVLSIDTHYILGQFSLLNRHKDGNEDRIRELGKLIHENGDRNHFATSIDLSFSKLMELYDLTKETDLESVKEILDGFQSNRIIHVNMKYPSDDTVRLTNVNIREKTYHCDYNIWLEIQGNIYPLYEGNVYRIGRDHDNAIQIDEKTVSRRHCEIQVNNNQVFIKDLNSTNGTFVNGEKIVENIMLNFEDDIRIGDISVALKRKIYDQQYVFKTV